MFRHIELFGYKLIYGLLQILNKYKGGHSAADWLFTWSFGHYLPGRLGLSGVKS